MRARSVAVVSTGSANLASVLAALGRAGLRPAVVTTADQLREHQAVILPGVGAFGAAMSRLTEAGMVAPLRHHCTSGHPLLAICLGLQLLADVSEETPGVCGLGVIRGTVRQLPATQRLPQMGWNRVIPNGNAGMVQNGWAYFANSYALLEAPADWQATNVEYGGRSVAALARGPQLACQFHPELSGAWGADLISRWSRQW